MRKNIVSIFTMVLLVTTVLWPYTIEEAKREITQFSSQKGLNAAEVEQATKSLSILVENGIPVSHALSVVKAAISENKTGKEIAEIASSLSATYQKTGYAKELCKISQNCIEAKMSVEECKKIMEACEDAINKDVSPRQLRLLVEELIKTKIDPTGLEAAIKAVSEAVERGNSPSEARLVVSQTVLSCLKEGLRGKKLAEQISTRAREQRQFREKERAGSMKGKPEHRQRVFHERREEYIRTGGGETTIPTKPDDHTYEEPGGWGWKPKK